MVQPGGGNDGDAVCRSFGADQMELAREFARVFRRGYRDSALWVRWWSMVGFSSQWQLTNCLLRAQSQRCRLALVQKLQSTSTSGVYASDG